MGVFPHGKTFWFEYRTRRPARRVVRSTGFRVDDPEGLKKARDAFAAFKLGLGLAPKPSAMEGILAAIYQDKEKVSGIPLGSMGAVYEDWCRGKAKPTDKKSHRDKMSAFAKFVKWAEDRNCTDISDVSVGVARDYVAGYGRSNKTVRDMCAQFSQIWEAVGQLNPGVFNPWKAARPDNDGSSVRKEIFTDEEVERILEEAKRVGHDWYLACMLDIHTGMRYGNIATMQIEDIDFDKWLFTGFHLKTIHSSKAEIFIPVAKALRPLLEPLRGKTGFVLPEHGVRYLAKTHMPVKPSFADILAAVGIKGREYGFHSFRHTANTRMAEAGISSEIRQIIFGWSNAEMAKHYDHARRIDQLREAVETL